ncbi:MAG TPA: hypothetical protein VKV23_00035 [Acidimicrobiales bacterium]|nr:hypothetical protein [Acidimicrobiales bacterium]
MTARELPPVLAGVAGQARAAGLLASSLAAPVHAYLFVGPPGCGKRELARAFAAALVCPASGCGACPSCRDALAGRHVDVVVVERQGASILVDDARAVVALAQRSPAAGARQVIILVDFHLVDEAGPALLKTLEEPPPSTVFLVLAEHVPPALATIASRCVTVELASLDAATIEEVLRAEGVPDAVAPAAAAAAAGRLDRARLLARDPGFAARQARWRAVLDRLDGTGATVALLAEELAAAPDELVEVLAQRQAAELDAALEAAARAGERRLVGRREIEERHRRERRRVRTDELRAGLATLAAVLRERLGTGEAPAHRSARLLAACAAIDAASKELVRNPNELLLLQSLLLELDA